MSSLDYIVRVYRFEKDKPKSIVGTVEEVGIEGKSAFTNLDELWKILNCPRVLPERSVRKATKTRQ